MTVAATDMMRGKQLAEQHWEYIQKLISLHGENTEILKKIEWHYKTAFIHGFKHGLEEKK